MNGFTALAALGSASPLSSPEIPAHAAAPTPVSTQLPAPPASPTFGMPPNEAAAIDDAPSPSPSAERAGSASLSLSLKYAPSAVPPDVRRAAHFDRSA